MTPYTLYKTYRSLSVTLADGTEVRGLDVHRYRINKPSSKHNAGAGLAEHKRLKSEIEKVTPLRHGSYQITVDGENACRMEDVPAVALLRTFEGKGSPDDIRQTLRIAVCCGRVLGNQTALQQYCDDYIGIDCSGFATTFYGGKYRGKKEYNAMSFLNAGPEARWLHEIQPNDAIVWKHEGHIALIDRVYPANKCLINGDPIIQCMVAESTGSRMVRGGPADGLAYSEYSFVPTHQKGPAAQHAPFRILRETFNNGKDSWSFPNIKIVHVQ